MFRSLILSTVLILFVSVLTALPQFVPSTMLAEDFTASWCQYCPDSYAGLDVLHNQFHNGEFLSLRYYSQSGELSNAEVDSRTAYYNATLFPTVFFNGLNSVTGGGTDIADGSTYLNLYNPKRFMASPIKIDILSFNSQTGAVSARVKMVDNDYALVNQSFRFILVENNVTPSATRVVRSIITQPISLSGVGNQLDFNASFTIAPTYIQANLWISAIVQLDDHSIIQSASNLPQPQFQIRAAMEFSQTIIAGADTNYVSETIWFYNYGNDNSYTIRLLKDSGPNDWYMNYCDEDGMCYPGFVSNPFNLISGAAKGFHLNLIVGSEGTCTFHFIVESSNHAPYIVPFTYITSGSSVNDNLIVPVSFTLMQNYPNPFSNHTTFTLNAKHPSQGNEIEVFNNKGQKIHSIKTSALKTGENHINWDAKDIKGKRLPDGIYFYRLKEDIVCKPRKMLIIHQ